jgi:hypothetical protein
MSIYLWHVGHRENPHCEIRPRSYLVRTRKSVYNSLLVTAFLHHEPSYTCSRVYVCVCVVFNTREGQILKFRLVVVSLLLNDNKRSDQFLLKLSVLEFHASFVKCLNKRQLRENEAKILGDGRLLQTASRFSALKKVYLL